MLARPLPALPPARRTPVFYQAKLDGFRVIAFVRDGSLFLQSRRGADLTPHFPDVAAGARQLAGEDVVLDGELVVPGPTGGLDFAALQQRARQRGRTAAAAAAATPAYVVVFDVLEHRGRSLLREPLHERWDLLRELFTRRALQAPWSLVSSTQDRDRAERWFEPEYGAAGIEGVVAKAAGGAYRPGIREWIKVRAYSTAEGIVAGVTGTPATPRTLLLGRYTTDGQLRLVARTTPLARAASAELGEVLVPGRVGHPWQGLRFTASWGSREPLHYETVEPLLVVEVRVDSARGEHGAHRHPVRYLRPRPELDPRDL
jgi:ATP-dependent DNA ligase